MPAEPVRRRLRRTSAVLLAAALSALLLPGPPAAAEPTMASLRADSARAAAELRRGTLELETAQARLADVRTRAARARADAEQATRTVEGSRARLRAVVGAAYRSPVPDDVVLALTVGPDGLTDALAARADLARVQGEATDLLRGATADRVRATELVEHAADLAAQERRGTAQVARKVAALRDRATRTQQRLTAAAAALERDRTPSAGDCAGRSTAGHANGFLPATALCPIGGGHLLRADAAAAFLRMNADRPQCVTDAYRPYAEQVDVYRRTPQLAAVPGTSRHGLGVALDLGCGAQRFGTDAYLWLKANAPRYGWVHPSWAEPGGVMPEPWHWEYVG